MVTVTVPGVLTGVPATTTGVDADCPVTGVCPGAVVATGAPNSGVIDGGSDLGVKRAPPGVAVGCSTEDAGTCCARLHARSKHSAQKSVRGIVYFRMGKIVLAKTPLRHWGHSCPLCPQFYAHLMSLVVPHRERKGGAARNPIDSVIRHDASRHKCRRYDL